MRTLRGVGNIPPDWPASAVTIGKFDGVHAGHRAVIEMLKERAELDGRLRSARLCLSARNRSST